MKISRYLINVLVIIMAACFLSSCSGIFTVIKTTDSPPACVSDLSPSILSTPQSADNTEGPSAAPPGGYYIVDKGDKAVAVNNRGEKILPGEYASIQPISYENGPVVFLAADGNAHVNKQGESNGGVFDSSGKELAPGSFISGNAINGSLIQVCDSSYYYGVISFSGKIIIPCEYRQIDVCGDEIAAVKGNYDAKSHKFDIYDMQGTLLRSKELQSGIFDTGEFAASGKDIIIMNASGKAGLIDTNFNVIIPEEWENIISAGSDAYILDSGSDTMLVNSQGYQILSGTYTNIQPDYDGKGNFNGFSASGPGGAYIFGANFKELFHTDKYDSISSDNGKYIAYKSQKMHAIDNKGKDLFPPADYIYWDTDSKVYVSVTYNSADNTQSTSTCYTEEGVKLNIQSSDSIAPISPERFIVSVTNKDSVLFGLYDRSGKEIIPPKYEELTPVNSNGLLVFSEKDDYGTMRSGVMDLNGNIIIPAGFDYIYGGENGGLLYAKSGTIHGLIDLKGNWIWYASDYDMLED